MNTGSDNQHCISIDLGGTSFKAGIVDRSGSILHRVKVGTPKNKPYSEVLGAIVDLIENLKKAAPGGIRKISIGVPGIIERSTGSVINCFNIFGSRKPPVNLRSDLKKFIEQDILLEKDANLAVIGEHWLGVGMGCRNLIFISLGTGIGSGVIIDNQLLHGDLGAASEFGHLTVERNGLPCGCGSRGCLEQYTSGPAIAQNLIRSLGEQGLGETGKDSISAETVFKLARGGNKVAERVIDEAAAYLGMVMANIVTIFNPELIILGGGVGKQFDVLITAIWKEIRLRCREILWTNLKIAQSRLGDDAAIIGGAKCVFDS